MIIISDLSQSYHRDLTPLEVNKIVGGSVIYKSGKNAAVKIVSSSTASGTTISSTSIVEEGDGMSISVYEITQMTAS
jgi:hypothetical protein